MIFDCKDTFFSSFGEIKLSVNFTAHICGTDFLTENRPRIDAEALFVIKNDRASMRAALHG